MSSDGIGRNSGLLGSRSSRLSRREASKATPTTYATEQGSKPVVRHYEAGPFPALEVRPFPAELVELFERSTGTRFDPTLIAKWERIRMFGGYVAADLTPALQAAQRLDDGLDHGEPLQAEQSRRAATASIPSIPSLSMPDPTDLGD